MKTDPAVELKALRDIFVRWSKMHPNEQPHLPNGMRPFSTQDVKHYAEVLNDLCAHPAQAEPALVDAKDAESELLREAQEALLPFAEAFSLANMNDTIGSYFTVAPFAVASQAYTRIDTALKETDQ